MMRKYLSIYLFLLLLTPVLAQQKTALPNFHQVNENLFRGAQPSPAGLKMLAERGVKTIINLRGESDETHREKIEVESLGLKYFNFPLPALSRPKAEEIRKILAIVNNPDYGPVFIHCKNGEDRTGTIVACYRISKDGWDAEQAIDEAKKHGMSSVQVGMRNFIKDFQHQLAGLSTRAIDLAQFFKGREGALVLYDLNRNQYLRYNEKRCQQRFSPFSTFKIPNSLIGLETGVIKDADFLIPWDQKKYPPETLMSDDWKRDQTLRSAFAVSAVWYYRELAMRVGADQMQHFIDSFHYGNQNISSGINGFWLNGSLQISADEQVEFLKKLYLEKLPISKRAVKITKDILIREKNDRYVLSAKTGGGNIGENNALGWYVGYLESEGNVYIFALNIEGKNFPDIRDERISITRNILSALRLL